jgi:Mrp family chromosome partitioning ATPase
MPPGTADVAITVMQSLPMSGIIMVTVPQDMVSMIVSKAVHMAEKMNVPVLGVVENMSYIKCPHCNETIDMFEYSGENFMSENVKILCKLPMSQELIHFGKTGITGVSDDILSEFSSVINVVTDLK